MDIIRPTTAFTTVEKHKHGAKRTIKRQNEKKLTHKYIKEVKTGTKRMTTETRNDLKINVNQELGDVK